MPTNDIPHDPPLTLAEAAKLIGCHERTVRNLISRGELSAQTVDGELRVALGDIRSYINANKPKATGRSRFGSRRRNGEGTYDRLPNGRSRYWLPPEPNGYRPSGTGKTPEEARKNAERNRDENRRPRTVATSNTTIKDFAPIWMRITGKNKIDTSKSDDAHRFKSRINPYIGQKTLRELDFFLLQDLVDAWDYDDEYSPSTIRGDFTRLRAMIRFARGIRLIDFDPTEQIVLPRIDIPNRALDVEQLRLRRKGWAKHENALLYDYYAFLGLRRGEGLGLLVTNLNKETRTIRVTHQVKSINGKATLVSRTKTPSGERELPVPPVLFEKTLQIVDQLEALKALAGNRWQENDLLFPNAVGTPQIPSSINHAFSDMQTKVGLDPVRLNDLRHTCATLVRSELNYEQDVVGALLGHRSKNVTGHYARVLLPLLRVAVERLENLILGRKS